jgi:hypothetical protein
VLVLVLVLVEVELEEVELEEVEELVEVEVVVEVVVGSHGSQGLEREHGSSQQVPEGSGCMKKAGAIRLRSARGRYAKPQRHPRKSQFLFPPNHRAEIYI